MFVLAKSALRFSLVSIALLQLYGCASDGTLTQKKDFIVNNTGMDTDDVIKVLKFNNSICKINKKYGHGNDITSYKVTNISESCIAKKYPTCSHWYQENLDMACVMNIAKPIYDVDMKARSDIRKADSLAQQQAEQAKKEHIRQLQFQYEQSPQGIADKERAVAENEKTRSVCNKVVDNYAEINMFEVISRNEYRKISDSKFSCMAIFKQGYEVHPIVVTYDSQSGRYVANPL